MISITNTKNISEGNIPYYCYQEDDIYSITNIIPPHSFIVCVPAYNQEKSILAVLNKVKKYIEYIIVIDDGSTDDTTVSALSEGAIVVRHINNRGYGAALNTSFNVARNVQASNMIILDSDGQHDPSYIPSFMEKINQNFDIVIGSRFIEKNNTYFPKYRKIGIKILDFFTNIILKNKVTDSQCGYRGYSKRAIDSINISSNGMCAGSEILIEASKYNLSINEIPIIVNYDIDGTSSQHPIVHGISVLVNLLLIRIRKK